jgi:hypothetical protein
MEPLAPALVVPDVNDSDPLTPTVPAFALLTEREPLEVATPSPLFKVSAPPVCELLEPDARVKVPPTPMSPLPTAMVTIPPVPPVAAPLPMKTEPLTPELLVPEANNTEPLTPAVPAFPDIMERAPLEVATPRPL